MDQNNPVNRLNELLGNRYKEIDLNGDMPFIPNSTSGLSSCLKHWDCDKIEEVHLEEKVRPEFERLARRFNFLSKLCKVGAYVEGIAAVAAPVMYHYAYDRPFVNYVLYATPIDGAVATIFALLSSRYHNLEKSMHNQQSREEVYQNMQTGPWYGRLTSSLIHKGVIPIVLTLGVAFSGALGIQKAVTAYSNRTEIKEATSLRQPNWVETNKFINDYVNLESARIGKSRDTITVKENTKFFWEAVDAYKEYEAGKRSWPIALSKTQTHGPFSSFSEEEELSHATLNEIVEPKYRTKETLRRWESELLTLEVSEEQGKKIHQWIAPVEAEIYAACKTASFDNPELLAVLYYYLGRPGVSSPEKYLFSADYCPSEHKALPQIRIHPLETEEQEESCFSKFLVERYLSPIEHQLAEDSSANPDKALEDALVLLVYTPEEIKEAKHKCREETAKFSQNTNDPNQGESLNPSYDYYSIYLPEESKNGVSLTETNLSSFLYAAIRDYAGLRRYHQEQYNLLQQQYSFNSTEWSGEEFPTVVEYIGGNHSFGSDEGKDQECQEAHKSDKFEVLIGDSHNIVNPGENVTVIYNSTNRDELPKSMTFSMEGLYGSGEGENVLTLGEDEFTREQNKIYIPTYTEPGVHQVNLLAVLPDGCEAMLTTYVTVTNQKK